MNDFPYGRYLQDNGLVWRPFMPGMRGFDPNDPFVKEIFELQDLLSKTIADDGEEKEAPL